MPFLLIPQEPASAACLYGQSNMVADILYSFDCDRAKDDISGTYDGFTRIPSSIPYDVSEYSRPT